MPVTRARARINKGKAVASEEPVSQREKGETSNRSKRPRQEGRSVSRTRQRREEVSSEPHIERGANQERQIEDKIAAAVEKAMQQWTTQAMGMIHEIWEKHQHAQPGNGDRERPGSLANSIPIIRMEDSLLEADRRAINAFLAQHPPKFAGEPDPIRAEQWMIEIKKLFRVSPCNDKQKMLCATHLLVGDAYEWWETLLATMPLPEEVTWKNFMEEFNKEYLPAGLQGQKVIEFEQLCQGEMTVTEYATKFNALVRFVPWIANVPENKAQRFQQGLKPCLREGLAPHLIRDYAASIESARALELETLRTHEEQRQFNFDTQGGGMEKERSKKVVTRTRDSDSILIGAPICEKCQKCHFGECLKGSNQCYKCGKTGHIAKNCRSAVAKLLKCFICDQVGHVATKCPQEARGQGRSAQQQRNMAVNQQGASTKPVQMYALTHEESQEQEEEEVTGTDDDLM